MPTCHCPECINCGDILFLWLLLSPPFANSIWDCRVDCLADEATDDQLADVCVPRDVLCCGDSF